MCVEFIEIHVCVSFIRIRAQEMEAELQKMLAKQAAAKRATRSMYFPFARSRVPPPAPSSPLLVPLPQFARSCVTPRALPPPPPFHSHCLLGLSSSWHSPFPSQLPSAAGTCLSCFQRLTKLCCCWECPCVTSTEYCDGTRDQKWSRRLVATTLSQVYATWCVCLCVRLPPCVFLCVSTSSRCVSVCVYEFAVYVHEVHVAV